MWVQQIAFFIHKPKAGHFGLEKVGHQTKITATSIKYCTIRVKQFAPVSCMSTLFQATHECCWFNDKCSQYKQHCHKGKYKHRLIVLISLNCLIKPATPDLLPLGEEQQPHIVQAF